MGFARDPSPKVVFIDDNGRAGIKEYSDVGVPGFFLNRLLTSEVARISRGRQSPPYCERGRARTLHSCNSHSEYQTIHPRRRQGGTGERWAGGGRSRFDPRATPRIDMSMIWRPSTVEE